MEILNILVVEDDETAFKGYQDASDDVSDANLKIELERSVSAKEAIQKLNKSSFQGAIIDLNLINENGSEEASGNEVISEIHKSFRIPIVVVSGNLHNLDNEFVNSSQFIKALTRGDELNVDIFQGIIDIFQTGILNIIGGKGLIEGGLSRVFWEHLSKDIDAWFGVGKSAEQSLLRYTLNHLSVYLDEYEEGSIDPYHEAEFYLKPPIKKNIASGDILQKNGSHERFILLSPACDIEVRSNGKMNAKSLVLARICNSDPATLLAGDYIKKNKPDNARSFIRSVVHGTKLQNAFLPPYKEIKEGVIEFHNLVTISPDDYNNYQRLATVSVSFFKDIQSRFSSYYARQGTPDLKKESIVDSYMREHFNLD